MKCGAWRVQCEVWSVKEAVGSEKCEVWNVKCEVWSVKFKFGVRRAQCEVWSVRFGVWRKQWEVRSVECEVWSVKCGVWSVKCGVRRVQCAVWGVECRGKDTVGTGCLWTIGHLCLGNFRRRFARVYVMLCHQLLMSHARLQLLGIAMECCANSGSEIVCSILEMVEVIASRTCSLEVQGMIHSSSFHTNNV